MCKDLFDFPSPLKLGHLLFSGFYGLGGVGDGSEAVFG